MDIKRTLRLKPVMNMATLFSTTDMRAARQSIVDARALINRLGYDITPNDYEEEAVNAIHHAYEVSERGRTVILLGIANKHFTWEVTWT